MILQYLIVSESLVLKEKSKILEVVYWNHQRKGGLRYDRIIVIFDYQPTRKGENAQAFLQGFTGYLVRDGYSGYHKVKGVKHCGCLIHCRRYFVNALPKEKEAHPSSVAAEAVRYLDRIYHEEVLLVNMTADERYKERLVKIKPLRVFFSCKKIKPPKVEITTQS